MKKNKKLKNNLKYSIMDGAANSAKIGFGESYLAPYAIALEASTQQVGFLKSIPHLIGSLLQFFSPSISEKIKSRKKIVVIGSILQALMFLPIILIPFLGFTNIWFLILLATLYFAFGMIASPSWSGWIGEIVPDKIKGKYFGKRNRIANLTSFITMIIGGIILQIFTDINLIAGFVIIFSLAIFSRLVSVNYLTKISEKKYIVPKETKFSFIQFVKKMNKTNYGIFVIYLCMISFSTYISSTYGVVYMLQDLKLSYFTYMTIIATAVLSNFIFIYFWGKYSDIFGNKIILKITGFLIPAIPFLYLVSRDVSFLIGINVFSGFAWSGFHLSAFNFVFDTVSPPKRVRCFSYYHVLNGIAIFLGATLGGILINFGTMFWSKIYLVFIISGVLRLISSIIFLPKIKEVKWVPQVSETRLMWNFTSDVFGSLKHPVVIVSSKRYTVKKQSEIILEKISKFIERTLGKRSKYG